MEKLKEEYQLVLSLAEFRNPDIDKIKYLLDKKLDWVIVLGELIYNRIAGLAFHVIKGSKIQNRSINRELYFGLYSIYEFQLKRSQIHSMICAEVIKEISESDFSYAVLKGSILSTSIYPEGCRVSNDIDILVDRTDVTKVGQYLKKLKFIQGYYDRNQNKIIPASRRDILMRKTNFGEVVPYQKVMNRSCYKFAQIDINFALGWDAQENIETVKQFLTNTADYPINYNNTTQLVSSLDPEYFLAHLCAHLYKEAVLYQLVNERRDLGFYKFTDIYAFITYPEIKLNWKRFVQLAIENDIIEKCLYALHFTTVLFPVLNKITILPDIIEELKSLKTMNFDLVFDPTSNTVYEWKESFLTRCFNQLRYKQLKKVVPGD